MLAVASATPPAACARASNCFGPRPAPGIGAGSAPPLLGQAPAPGPLRTLLAPLLHRRHNCARAHTFRQPPVPSRALQPLHRQPPCAPAPHAPQAPLRAAAATATPSAGAPSTMSTLGQNVNTAGISLFLSILWGNQRLALPHISVPDIRWLDWAALAAAGFRGCVFDKDGTLSAPFAPQADPRVAPALAACKEAFGGRVVLYSNSAGLQQYDPQGHEAEALERSLGVPVLRHRDKKPGGSAQELEQHFGCPAHQLVMIGDRYLTDVVFGNRHGMLAVYVTPLTMAGEPTGVWLARGIEDRCVARWAAQQVRAPDHPLLAHDALHSVVRDPGVW